MKRCVLVRNYYIREHFSFNFFFFSTSSIGCNESCRLVSSFNSSSKSSVTFVPFFADVSMYLHFHICYKKSLSMENVPGTRIIVHLIRGSSMKKPCSLLVMLLLSFVSLDVLPILRHTYFPPALRVCLSNHLSPEIKSWDLRNLFL